MEGTTVLRAAGFELPDTSLDALVSVSHRRSLAKGDYLFHKGDPNDALLFVVSGTVQAVSSSYEGRELVFRDIRPNAVIGELTIVDGAPRSASIRALIDSELLVIPRDAFLRVARSDAEIGLALARLCAHQARRLSTWAEGVSFTDTGGRLIGLLVELADESLDGVANATEIDKVKLKVTQQTLADRLGVTRESVNKALRTLEDDRMVDLGRGSVTVLDLDELRWRVVD